MSAKDLNGFRAPTVKLSDEDIPRIGHRIGVGEDVMHAVMDAETGGSGVDKQGRLKALYEPHLAWRYSSGETRKKLAAAGLAYPKWKRNYPADSYLRILAAMKIDREVALKSTSWALPQILGSNHEEAGFDSAEEMVLAFTEDEDNQIEAMIEFVRNTGLDDELRALEKKLRAGRTVTPDDCRAFVRGYNGKEYAKNNYHVTFARNLARWAKIRDTPWTPGQEEDAAVEVVVDTSAALYDGKYHEEVEAVQRKLDAIGYPEVGDFDGKWGNRTRAAVLAFRADHSLPLTPTITEQDFLAALALAKPGSRPQAPERADATVADLREKKVEEIAVADNNTAAAAVVGGGGLLAGLGQVTDWLDGNSDKLGTVGTLVEQVGGFVQENIWLVAIGAGAFVIWQSGILKKVRLAKHQTGNDVSR